MVRVTAAQDQAYRPAQPSTDQSGRVPSDIFVDPAAGSSQCSFVSLAGEMSAITAMTRANVDATKLADTAAKLETWLTLGNASAPRAASSPRKTAAMGGTSCFPSSSSVRRASSTVANRRTGRMSAEAWKNSPHISSG
jgi:hypothetical protein